MRRKIEKEEGFEEGQLVERWSGARIFVGLIVLAIIIFGGAIFFSVLQDKTSRVLGSSTHVQRTVNGKEVKLPSADSAQELLETAKKELDKITSENVSASDGAIQKVISDLQKVQNGGQTPVDAICKMICKQ